MPLEPPPYWADCPLVGRPIPNTPFLTCKTPITPSSSPPLSSSSPSPHSTLPPWCIPPESTFTLSMLLRHVERSLQLQLSLIIDLTDGRFYDPQPLCSQHRIQHINLYLPPSPSSSLSPYPSPSPSSPPPPLAYTLSPAYLSTLFHILDVHLSHHPSSTILLHDIYSYDLSLTLIGLYLTHHSLPPSLAFHAVCASRPPGISHPQLVRLLYERGEEEVEWDLAVLQRPAWMAHCVSNWTWSGVGDREEKRERVLEGQGVGQKQGQEEEEQAGGGEAVEEKKETVKPAGTIRRKQKKEPAPPAAAAVSSSSPSTSPSPSAVSAPAPSAASSFSDPFADLLAEAGVKVPSSSSAAAPTTTLKRKAPASGPPASSSSSPPPPPSPPPPSSLLPVHQQHSYLVPVKMPHLQRLLSTLVHLILNPSSHPPSTFPLLTPSDLRAKLVMLCSWHDRQPLTRPLLDQARTHPSHYVLSWTPVAHQCFVLILKEGTFLHFPSTSSPCSSALPTLPPLYHVPHLSFPTRSSPQLLISHTVASAVLLFDMLPPAPPTPRLLLTDLLSSASHHPLPASIVRRMAMADADVVMPRAQRRAVDGEGRSGVGVGVRCKKYFPLDKCQSVLAMDVPHEREGVELVVDKGDGRRGGRVWVWKKSSSDISQAELVSALKS